VIKVRCDDFDELLYLLRDGRIDEEKKKKLEKHLSACKRCREKLAFLESVEKRARGIEIREPSQEYWDTFSSRVTERIAAQKEESFLLKLKNFLQNVFAFSPLKIKVAAGVVSVVLVFIVGKLYVDYRGKQIVPTKPPMESTKAPAIHAPEAAKEIAPPEEKAKKREKRTLVRDEVEKGVSPGITGEGKTAPAAPLEQEIEKKKGSTPPGEELERTQSARGIPEGQPLPETIELKEEVSLSETQVTRVGAEGKGKVLEKVVAPEHKARDAEEIQLKGITKVPAGEPAQLAFDRGVKTPDSVMDYFTVDDKRIPKMTEDDTLLQEDVLRKAIETWSTYIEQNPGDSLANEGCLQVAIGYHLLSRLTEDESDLSEGIKLLEKYEKQIADPKTKGKLNKKLKQLKALKEK
jgi:hypothetical protein